jgi:pimeloyl-ACP methyl ester carboxylesterase
LLSLLQHLLRLDLRRQGATFRTLEVAGSRIWYADIAARRPQAPTLLLLHGLGSSASAFHALVPALRGHFRLLLPDLPGCAWSRLPPGRDFLSLPELVDGVEQVLAGLAPEGAHLAGHSMGGWIATRLAARRPDLVKGLALLNPAGPELTPGAWDAFLEVARPGAAASAYLARLFHKPPWSLGLFAGSFGAILRGPPVAKLISALGPGDFVTAAELAAVRCPALLLWGEGERLIPTACRDFYGAHLPGLRIERLEACGHCPHVEQPERTVRAIAALATGA